MKIIKVILEDFHQFKKLEIDLTYPKGHAKAGEPLDKVCIIGQSGTGKTTLLKIISGHTFTLSDLFKEYDYKDFEKVRVLRKLNNIVTELRVTFEKEKGQRYYTWINYTVDGKKQKFEDALAKQNEQLEKIKTQFIYFPSDLKYENIETTGKSILDEKVIDFSKEKLGDVWQIILTEIQTYQETELKLRQNISKIAEGKNNLNEIQKAVKKLERWRKKEFNPIKSIAENCLDPLLKNFNLRVRQNLDFEKKDDLGFIKIEDFDGNLIPHGLLSTGTKQILLSALPLYLLKPENTLILFDEPERSLYPNIQKIIIDFYLSLTKNSQFFFSTHSPIIASCFEPWEIVELKFDENRNVIQDKYYEGERHVDNYKLIPSYLTYDLMLNKIFDLQETYSSERTEKITEVLMLRNQLKKLKETEKLNTKQGKIIQEKYKKLASQLFWDFDFIK